MIEEHVREKKKSCFYLLLKTSTQIGSNPVRNISIFKTAIQNGSKIYRVESMCV